MSADVRWKQRFSNLERAMALLEEALDRPSLSKLEKEGVVQRFEFTFELTWKTLRDYLKHGGIEADLPRDVLKQAFANRLITDGQVWIDMLESRNLLSHVYDEPTFEKTFNRITRDFRPALRQAFTLLKNKS